LSTDRIHPGESQSIRVEPKAGQHGWIWAAVLCAVCVLPAILMLFGIDFSTGHNLSGRTTEFLAMDQRALSGSYTHTILEWTAVCAAAFACLFCLSHFALSDEPSVPVIGIALACAGAMDAFHTLAADHLIVAIADNRELIPFTWALSRMFHAGILLVGVGLFIRRSPSVRKGLPQRTRGSVTTVCLLGLLFVVIAAVLVVVCAHSARLPKTMFPHSLIKRPYDVAPIIMYLLSATVVFPLYYRRHRSIFALAIFLSLIPQIATQLYMVFGSEALFDGAFNVAHALKVLGYTVPCIGILTESRQVYHELYSARKEAHAAEQELLGYVCQLEDTRERIEGQAAMLEQRSLDLDDALAEVEQASRAKSEFLANMSHEIRTPMTAILGFIDILGDELNACENTAEIQDIFDTVQRNGEYLLKLIDDILDLSKIESGRLEVECIACSPRKLIDDVVLLMQVRADAKELSLDVRWDGPIPDSIQTDPTRLRQILINLIGNAIKFTEQGSVSINSRLIESNDVDPRMQFDVVDTGIGLTDEQAKNLFRPFTQADSSTTRKFGGTGLGLAISRRLAEMLGGTIAIDSTLGQGSRFTVTISTGPLDQPQQSIRRHPERASKRKSLAVPSQSDKNVQLSCRVLLAEDGPDNQRLIAFLLKKAGADVTVVNNGREAVECVLPAMSHAGEGRQFDVILMDMQMPVLDGYGATAELRHCGYSGPIIALTANAMDGDRDKCLSAGCDDYTTKPIDRHGLLSLVARYADQAGQPVHGAC